MILRARAHTPSLERQAVENAQGNYHGPPEREPVVATMLQSIEADARRFFTARHDLRNAQLKLAHAAAELMEARAELDAIVGGREYGSGRVAEGRRSESRVATKRLRAAESTHRAQEVPTNLLADQVIDELGAHVEQLLAKPTTYLRVFDERRLYEGRRGLGPLPTDIVPRIVRRAITSPLDIPDQSGEQTGPVADQRRQS